MRFFIVLTILMSPLYLHARKPAVEPVSGLSYPFVEKEVTTSPDLKKDFYKFSTNEKDRSPSSKDLQDQSSNTVQEVSIAKYLQQDFSYLLLLLPFMILPFGVFYLLRKKNEQYQSHSARLSIIDGDKKPHSNGQDHDDIKKAS